MNEDFQKYCDCMEQIKVRIGVIDFILGDLSSWKTTPMTDIEFLFLQFRKILELIAFSSICANRETYQKVRREVNSNWENDWRADGIIKIIENFNPNFFPIPVKEVVDSNSTKRKLEMVKNNVLDKSLFKTIYGQCKNFLHAEHPYNASTKNLSSIKKKMLIWKNKIINLLNTHTVQLIDLDKRLHVYMQDANTGNVVVWECKAI